MKKKAKVLLFCAALIALTACGGNNDSTSTKSETAAKAAPAKEAAKELEGSLVSEKPIELDIHMHFRNKYHYDENWPVAQEAAKLTNVTLKNVASTTGTNSTEIFNIMMVSGKLPDIVGGDKRKDDFIRYGMEGAFIPLNDLIAQHAPDIAKFLDAHPAIKKAITAPDGNLYYIPYIQDGRVSRGYWIRQDWLDKLGLEQPNNVDELYKVLKAFKTQDPNGNGTDDEIPMIFRHWNEMFRIVTLFGGRSAGTDNAVTFYMNDDGKIAHGWAEPEFKEGVKAIAKWYGEGLIDPEVFTRGKKTREILFTSNQGGMTHDWMASTAKFNQALADDIPGFNLQPMLPPVNVNGDRIEENQRALVKPDGWAITMENDHPVETIKYMNFFFTEEGRRLANFGVEGVHYEMENGAPQFVDAVLDADKAVNQQMWEVGAQIPIGFQMDYEYERQWTNEIAAKGVKMYSSDQVKYFEDFVMPNLSVEERSVYDAKWTYIQTYMEETVQKWILQGADIDAEWDEYVETLENLGLNDVIAVLQKASER